VLTLRTPSFHVGAGRAFTENYPTSDALCHSAAPACRLLSPTNQLPLATALYHAESDSPQESESPHRPLVEPGRAVTRRWRNDSERLSSCRLLCELALIEAAFQPPGPDVLRRRTEPITLPLLRRFGVMPAHRFAKMIVSPNILAEGMNAFASRPPPVATRPSWRRATVARVSGLDGLLQARPPFYGLSCDSPRSLTPMRIDRFLLPTASITSTRASSVPGASSKLALRPWAVRLRADPRDRGTGRFTTPDPLWRAARVGARRFLPRTPERTVPLAPLSPPHSSARAYARTDRMKTPRRRGRSLREVEISHSSPRCLPSMGDTRAHARAGTDLD